MALFPYCSLVGQEEWGHPHIVTMQDTGMTITGDVTIVLGPLETKVYIPLLKLMQDF